MSTRNPRAYLPDIRDGLTSRERIVLWHREFYAYKAFGHNIRNWVMAQLALYETQIYKLVYNGAYS